MNKQIRKREKMSSDTYDAVSPVIGVMLMLVVTIIIAAFVSVFSGNAFGNTETTPSAAMDVKLISNGGADKNQYVMLIEHHGGSGIPTSDLRIISYYTPPSSTKKTMQRGEVTASTKAVSNMIINGEAISSVKIPYLNDVSRGKPGEAGTNFGEYTFSSGDVISTGGSAGTTTVLGFDVTTPENCAIFGFGRGSAVDVEIIHLPSQKSLYSGRVIVQ
ncbi:type IV pilin N-terminal domain-containing protein [Methanofollis ethanolicus]|uniref:type IV pilin N-terminal domain-containing protein n=1 Tax=Methanofollis ethanolicus TaxID=488124 RepID=UPI00083034A4|nr:type IV pilin N-terminal domain-containing protein [Methanofollis ethanolicus]